MARYVVTVGNDENDGNFRPNDLSLREAIILANNSRGPDKISFAADLAGDTLVLTLGALSITGDVDIRGDINRDNIADITISGNNASRIFSISGSSADVDLTGLTLTNGKADRGGAIIISGGASLDISNSTIQDSNAGLGGAIYNEGKLTTTNVLIYHNSAIYGGGVYTSGAASFKNTTIDSNVTATLDGTGGGVFATRGNVTFRDSTITDNFAGYVGGGIALDDGAQGTAIDSIFANRTDLAGGPDDVAILFSGETASMDARHSFFSIGTYVFDFGGSIFGGDPRLGPLQDNGGPVLTRLVLPGSPATGMGAEPPGRGNHIRDGGGHKDNGFGSDTFDFRLDALERDSLADSTTSNSPLQFAGPQFEAKTYRLADDANDRFVHKVDMDASSDHSNGVHVPLHSGHFDIA